MPPIRALSSNHIPKMVIYVGYSLERLVSLSNFDMFHPAIEDTLSNKAL